MASLSKIFYFSLSSDAFQKNYYRILYLIFYYFIAIVLLFSGTAKIIDSLPLINTLKLFTFIPQNLQIVIATFLPLIEIGLALLMFFRIKIKLTLTIVAILFIILLVFSIYGMLAGYSSECGCFGSLLKSKFGLIMLIKNILFLLITLVLLLNEKLFLTLN